MEDPGAEARDEPGGRQGRGDATTARLVKVARGHFARHGFAGASLGAIVRGSGLSKGAVYHHFKNKRALFEAVYEHEEIRLCRQVEAAGDACSNPVDAARARWEAFLDGALEPGVQQITLIDAPSVLGWPKFREIAARHGLALIRRGLEEVLPPPGGGSRDLGVLALMLHGSLTEGAMLIARADDPVAARAAVEAEFGRLLVDLAGRSG